MLLQAKVVPNPVCTLLFECIHVAGLHAFCTLIVSLGIPHTLCSCVSLFYGVTQDIFIAKIKMMLTRHDSKLK